jgi:hypothetical protein
MCIEITIHERNDFDKTKEYSYKLPNNIEFDYEWIKSAILCQFFGENSYDSHDTSEVTIDQVARYVATNKLSLGKGLKSSMFYNKSIKED